MRRSGRPREESFHSAETWGYNRKHGVAEKSLCRFHTLFQFKTQHATEAVEQISGTLILRVALEPRVVDLCDTRMFLQELGNPERTLILRLHANSQRFHAAMQ